MKYLLIGLLLPIIAYANQNTDFPRPAVQLNKGDYVYFCTMPVDTISSGDEGWTRIPPMCTKIHKDALTACKSLPASEGNLSCPSSIDN